MVAIEPGHRASQQETADLRTAEIENQGPPNLMFSLSWIGIFVKVCAVKMGEGEKVLWKVRRHPVQNHPDAVLMERVHQIHEILRRAVAAGGSVETGDLISPRAAACVYGQ